MSTLYPILAALRAVGATRTTAYHGDGGLAEVYTFGNGRSLLVEAFYGDGVILWLPSPHRSLPDLARLIRSEAHAHATHSA